jgi:hypothetical protein
MVLESIGYMLENNGYGLKEHRLYVRVTVVVLESKEYGVRESRSDGG